MTRSTHFLAALTCAASLAAGLAPAGVQAQSMDAYIGQMAFFGGTFCPRDYLPADGRLLPISGNEALFALIGTTYGGNGTATFALPDTRGRSLVGTSSSYPMGASGGLDQVALNAAEMPAHSHSVSATKSVANQKGAAGDYLAYASSAEGQVAIYHEGPSDSTLSTNTISVVGESVPHENRSPYLASYWCIVSNGVFPPRN